MTLRDPIAKRQNLFTDIHELEQALAGVDLLVEKVRIDMGQRGRVIRAFDLAARLSRLYTVDLVVRFDQDR